MIEFIIANKGTFTVAGILAFLLFMYWFSSHMLEKINNRSMQVVKTDSCTSLEPLKPSKDFSNYRDRELWLNIKTGKFCSPSGEPIEELSLLVAEMDAHWKFVYDFEGLMRVRINSVYSNKDSPFYSATVYIVEAKDICFYYGYVFMI